MKERETSGGFLLPSPADVHALCHGLHDPVAVITLPRGSIIDANRAWRALFGEVEAVADLGGAVLARTLSAWDGARPRLIPRVALRGTEGRARLLALPGTVPLQAFFQFVPGGAVPERLQELLDERLQQIRAFERLRSLGEVAAVIVHEMRSPLTSIRFAVDSVRRSPALDAPLQRKLDTALEQLARLERLLSGIRHYTRPLPLAPRRLDARETISAALRAVEGRLQGPQTTVTVEVRPDPLAITADPDLLGEALQNVVVNAVEAMPQGGSISIVAAPSRRRPGWVEIRIADRGPGVPAAAQEKLFQPFFTTKPEGTGLGLPIVKKIIELHGGRVILKSAEGKGTTVVIELPSADGS